MALSDDPLLKVRCRGYAVGLIHRLRGSYAWFAEDRTAEHDPVDVVAQSIEAVIVNERVEWEKSIAE